MHVPLVTCQGLSESSVAVSGPRHPSMLRPGDGREGEFGISVAGHCSTLFFMRE